MKLGAFIKQYRQKNKLTLRDFAGRCGTSHSYISMLEEGKNSKTGEPITPSLATLVKISGAMNMTLHELVTQVDDMPVELSRPTILDISKATGKRHPGDEDIDPDSTVTVYLDAKPKAKRIPVYGSVAAGIPLEAIQDIEDYEEITEDMARSGKYAALKIKGNSMLPRFTPGDVVIVRLQDDVDNGDIAIVMVNGDEATCKKIKKTPEGVMLISTNPDYEPMFYSNQEIAELPVRIWGKVVELRAKF